MLTRLVIFTLMFASTAFSQMPPIEPGVSQELAKWRAARYSDVRYKLDLHLEKMSPVLKGTVEIRVNVRQIGGHTNNTTKGDGSFTNIGELPIIILDWRKIKGKEELSAISNVFVNGFPVRLNPNSNQFGVIVDFREEQNYFEFNEHLAFSDGVRIGENVIKLDFTSPILASGSAITRYIDKEDGSEYIYSLFVPSDASTAFPVFDQPDLKARFSLAVDTPKSWFVVSNSDGAASPPKTLNYFGFNFKEKGYVFEETKPISTYVFAIAAGPFSKISQGKFATFPSNDAVRINEYNERIRPAIYVRRSQAEKFQTHSYEVFRLNREAIKYLETYFDYKFPWPKYDLVLIPEFPFGGMEHAGATFLREQSIIFPQEPTKNDVITRANLIFHEAAHQWFGDTVTMRWFDDLWLKEGFATFMAYKALERIMPESNAWKVFYERVKQAAYQTDSTRGTTAIYQPLPNLSAAKSAYGNIVYNKAPAFLRQAEFYLGEDKFQTAVRAFLKKHEFANAGWEDLVNEFANASWRSFADSNRNQVEEELRVRKAIMAWADTWVKKRGVSKVRLKYLRSTLNEQFSSPNTSTRLPSEEVYTRNYQITQSHVLGDKTLFGQRFRASEIYAKGRTQLGIFSTSSTEKSETFHSTAIASINAAMPDARDLPIAVIPNAKDYGYGIFLLDDKSRDYVLKNIQNEKDAFLRTMMWGSLWDSVREGELDPKEYVELVIKNIGLEKDEGTIQTLLSRVTTAMNYYMPPAPDLRSRLEDLLIDKIENASTQGQRITYYRAFLNIVSTDKARDVLKQILKASAGNADKRPADALRAGSPRSDVLRTKDKFDIVTRLAILGDADAAKLLDELAKTETSDDAKRYAYATRAAFATPENKAKFWNDFVNNKDISESWIEAAVVPFNSIRHSELTLPYLEKALAELPALKRSRKIFFVNGWLAAFIGGQRDEKALAVINKFLADNPNLDNDLRLKILENVDVIERAVKIRGKYLRN
ncbi:MAG: M1 family aminopeptidase [Pyrinomonadaceae bacterium]